MRQLVILSLRPFHLCICCACPTTSGTRSASTRWRRRRANWTNADSSLWYATGRCVCMCGSFLPAFNCCIAVSFRFVHPLRCGRTCLAIPCAHSPEAFAVRSVLELTTPSLLTMCTCLCFFFAKKKGHQRQADVSDYVCIYLRFFVQKNGYQRHVYWCYV